MLGAKISLVECLDSYSKLITSYFLFLPFDSFDIDLMDVDVFLIHEYFSTRVHVVLSSTFCVMVLFLTHKCWNSIYIYNYMI